MFLHQPGLILSSLSILHVDAEDGFFFNIVSIKLLAWSIIFLNSSSEASYILQSDATKSTSLSPFLTKIQHINENREYIYSTPPWLHEEENINTYQNVKSLGC